MLMNLFIKRTDSDTENSLWLPKGKGNGDKVDELDKQPGPTV